jgi:hypothetical protein
MTDDAILYAFSATREHEKLGIDFSKYLLLRDLFTRVAIRRAVVAFRNYKDFNLDDLKGISRWKRIRSWEKYCATYGITSFVHDEGCSEPVNDKVILKFGSDCYLVPKDLCMKALVLGYFPNE